MGACDIHVTYIIHLYFLLSLHVYRVCVYTLGQRGIPTSSEDANGLPVYEERRRARADGERAQNGRSEFTESV